MTGRSFVWVVHGLSGEKYCPLDYRERRSHSVCPIRTGRGVMSLAEVRLQEGESIENALRRFKRKVQTEDIIKEVKRHSFYLKPGAKRRVKQALARKRARKKFRKDSE
jgi:small subunit ribosomal protein S21